MKHGIILQATNENSQDVITYDLYEYLRGSEENKDVKHISAGFITIDGNGPIHRNPVEILRCIQEFLENYILFPVSKGTGVPIDSSYKYDYVFMHKRCFGPELNKQNGQIV